MVIMEDTTATAIIPWKISARTLVPKKSALPLPQCLLRPVEVVVDSVAVVQEVASAVVVVVVGKTTTARSQKEC